MLEIDGLKLIAPCPECGRDMLDDEGIDYEELFNEEDKVIDIVCKCRHCYSNIDLHDIQLYRALRKGVNSRFKNNILVS